MCPTTGQSGKEGIYQNAKVFYTKLYVFLHKKDTFAKYTLIHRMNNTLLGGTHMYDDNRLNDVNNNQTIVPDEGINNQPNFVFYGEPAPSSSMTPPPSQPFTNPAEDRKRQEKENRKALKKAKKAEKKAAKYDEDGVKKHSTGSKIVAWLLGAAVFGIVAGGACYGVCYAGYKLFPFDKTTSDNKTVSTPIGLSASQTGNVIVNKDITATIPDYSDIVNNVISSVVTISCKVKASTAFGQSTTGTSSGSGFIVAAGDEEMLIVTNQHVIDSAKEILVTFNDGNSVKAKVKGSKSEIDVAVLTIEPSEIPSGTNYSVATIGSSTDAKVGESAIVIGNALGYGISVTTGCISALDKSLNVEGTVYEHLIQTEASINHGNSGGPMFNSKGEVIGINSVTVSSAVADNMGYAISIDSVSDIINKIAVAEKKNVVPEDQRGYIGITGYSITSDIASTYGYPVGVLINSVSDGSGAAEINLEENDIITSFDGIGIDSFDKLTEALSYHKVGDSVEIEYYRIQRNGTFKKYTDTIKLGEKPTT